jgi:Recombinase zinc beta ribbon domain
LTTGTPKGPGASAFVRCEACGRPLTGSWSKGRNGRYAYYHCQRQCRAVNVSKAVLEGAFVDELALLQPTRGYMRLVKDRILHVWEQRRSEASERTTEQERRVRAIQQKLDRLDEAFLYSESIDLTSYSRQRDKLREELTLAQIARATPKQSMNSTCRASWRSQNASCRAHQTCGSRRRSTTSSDCSSCSFRKELRTTEIDSIEPPQQHRFSGTWRRLRVLMKRW